MTGLLLVLGIFVCAELIRDVIGAVNAHLERKADAREAWIESSDE